MYLCSCSCAYSVRGQLDRGELKQVTLISAEGKKVILTYPPAMEQTMQRAIADSGLKAIGS